MPPRYLVPDTAQDAPWAVGTLLSAARIIHASVATMSMFAKWLGLGAEAKPELPANGSVARGTPEFFKRQGYLIKDGFLDKAATASIRDAVDRAWSDRTVHNSLVISAYTGTENYIETYLRNVDPAARDQPYKLNHLYLRDPMVLNILLSDEVTQLAESLLGGPPLLFNSLSMEHGTEQPCHFDTFFMPPPVENRMVVFWFALEDVKPGSGALQYYPRSHTIPAYRFSHGGLTVAWDEMDAFDQYIDSQITDHDLTAERFHANEGDVFVWHAQLFHGGTPIEDPKSTRSSLVAHYWCADDFPDEMVLEARPGRFMLEPGFMCQPQPFHPGGRSVVEEAE